MATTVQRIDGGRAGRVYQLPDGRVFPSVTAILQVIGKPALVAWAAKVEREFVKTAAAELYREACEADHGMTKLAFMASLDTRLGSLKAHQRESDKALDTGKQVHAMIEWWARGRLGQDPGPEPKLSPAARAGWDSFNAWISSCEIEPTMVEQMIWHSKVGYAGTLDWLATKNDILGVVDFKTSNGLYIEHLLQIAAYASAINHMGHGPVLWGMVVQLPKDGSVFQPSKHVKTLDTADLGKHFDGFMTAFELHRWLGTNPMEGKDG